MMSNSVLKLDIEEIESDELPLKLSALTHAARVGQIQFERSLGPGGDATPEKTKNTPNNKMNENGKNMKNGQQSPSIKSNESDPLSSMKINRMIDYEIYDKYGLLKFAEKQRRNMVRKELEEKRKQLLIAQNQKNLQDNKNATVEETPNDIKSKLEQLIIEEAENVASALTAENERRMHEQNEEHRKIIEQIKNQHALRQHHALCKSIIDCQMKFGACYEEFSKKIRASKPSERLEKLKQSIIALLVKYNTISEKLKKSAGADIVVADLQQAEQLCIDLEALRKQFETDALADGAETVVDSPAAVSTANPPQASVASSQVQTQQSVPPQNQPSIQPQNQQSVQPQSQQQQAPQDASVNASNTNISGINNFISPQNLAFYNDILAYYQKKVDGVKPLQADDSMKKYRSNCQKAINIPVNAISAVNAEHLQDKYDKLYGLISGGRVNTSDGPISVNDHPLGRDFCLLLLAKKFVSQGDSTVSSNPQAAFPIAAIIVAIWKKVPEFRQLFLAYAFKESPYIVPYFTPQVQGQSIEDYFKTLGYRFSGGSLEQQDMYLKRQSGLVRLYSAVMVTTPRAIGGSGHPYGIENGWRWLNSMLNLDPLPDICATLILGFLQTAGFLMSQTYRGQFMKLLKTLQNQYLPRLSKIDEGGPKARLEVFLNKVMQENTIEKPPGLLAPNFW